MIKSLFSKHYKVEFVNQCLHWGRGLIPTLSNHSAAIPLRKELTVYYLVFFDGTLDNRSRVCDTLHCTHIKCHLQKKSRPLWLVQQNMREGNLQKSALLKTDCGCWSMRGLVQQHMREGNLQKSALLKRDCGCWSILKYAVRPTPKIKSL